MDLFGPTRIASLGGMKYSLVIVDDYSRFKWILFIAHKDKIFKIFKKFYKRLTNLKAQSIIFIHSNRGIKFKN